MSINGSILKSISKHLTWENVRACVESHEKFYWGFKNYEKNEKGNHRNTSELICVRQNEAEKEENLISD